MELHVGNRLLVTAQTQRYLPDGYNWIGSAPIVRGFTVQGNVLVVQFGYPDAFLITAEQAQEMRAAYLAAGGS